MSELLFYKMLLYSFLGSSVPIFVILFFITVPYGRHSKAGKSGWGKKVNPKLGWLIMEIPAVIVMLILFLVGPNNTSAIALVFLIVWQIHYIERSLVYPLLMRSNRKMPLTVMFMGALFNLVNGYLQGRWIYALAPTNTYNDELLKNPQIWIGFSIFLIGFGVNLHSDHILRKLRNRKEEKYSIPKGGLYRWVSCPNYLGEILEWLGWAIAIWSMAGLVFFVWTIVNLVPRAYSHHNWYKKKFTDYPEKRNALVPFLF